MEVLEEVYSYFLKKYIKGLGNAKFKILSLLLKDWTKYLWVSKDITKKETKNDSLAFDLN